MTMSHHMLSKLTIMMLMMMVMMTFERNRMTLTNGMHI